VADRAGRRREEHDADRRVGSRGVRLDHLLAAGHATLADHHLVAVAAGGAPRVDEQRVVAGPAVDPHVAATVVGGDRVVARPAEQRVGAAGTRDAVVAVAAVDDVVTGAAVQLVVARAALDPVERLVAAEPVAGEWDAVRFAPETAGAVGAERVRIESDLVSAGEPVATRLTVVPASSGSGGSAVAATLDAVVFGAWDQVAGCTVLAFSGIDGDGVVWSGSKAVRS